MPEANQRRLVGQVAFATGTTVADLTVDIRELRRTERAIESREVAVAKSSVKHQPLFALFTRQSEPSPVVDYEEGLVGPPSAGFHRHEVASPNSRKILRLKKR